MDDIKNDPVRADGADDNLTADGTNDFSFEEEEMYWEKDRNWGQWLMTAVVVVGLVALVLWVIGYLGFALRPFAAGGDAGDWKAVFLTNGQVYFGKVANEKTDPLVLEDIYYLQVQQQLQPAPEGQQAQPQQSLSLVKFGNELHGPEDEMRITRRNVLYVESLKETSRVVDAINRFVAAQQNQGQQQPAPQQ